MCLGSLGDPGGDSGSVGAVTETGNDTTDDELDETADAALSRAVAGAVSRNSDDSSDDLRVSHDFQVALTITKAPRIIMRLRPIFSPIKYAKRAPKKQPTS